MSLAEVAKLTFYAPDYEAFPALNLAKHAASLKGDRGAVLNGANEAAVGLFLNSKIGFTDIAERVAYALDTIPYKKDITLDDVLAADKAAQWMLAGMQNQLDERALEACREAILRKAPQLRDRSMI